jgi:hypothetical protein
MGSNGRLRSVVLLRTSTGTPGGSDAWRCYVGDLRSYNRSMAGYRRERVGVFGSGVDGRSEEPRYAVGVSPIGSLRSNGTQSAAPSNLRQREKCVPARRDRASGH